MVTETAEAENTDHTRDVVYPLLVCFLLLLVAAIPFYIARVAIASFVLLVAISFHLVIYDRSVSVPLLPAILTLLLCVPVLWVNEMAGVVLYLVATGLALTLTLSVDWSSPVAIVPTVFVLAVAVHLLAFPTLAGGDELTYFRQLGHYSSIWNYLSVSVTSVVTDPFVLRDSTVTYPLFYLPMYFVFEAIRPVNVALVNTVLWFATALMIRDLVIRSLDTDVISPNVAFALLLLSPSAIYWTGTFAKEITSVFLVVLASYLFLRERYLLFVVALVLATGVRPYAVAIVAVYIAVFKRSHLLLVFGLAGSVTFVIAYAKSPIPLVNAIPVAPYMFISPVPLDVTNWLTLSVLPRTIEGVVVGSVLCVSIVFWLLHAEYRRTYVLLGLGICIYALILTVVGYHSVVTDGEPYGLFTIADSLLRKKMGILPLVYLWVTYTVGLLRTNTVLPRIEVRY